MVKFLQDLTKALFLFPIIVLPLLAIIDFLLKLCYVYRDDTLLTTNYPCPPGCTITSSPNAW